MRISTKNQTKRVDVAVNSNEKKKEYRKKERKRLTKEVPYRQYVQCVLSRVDIVTSGYVL